MGNYASDKKNARFFGLKLSRETDGDLIEILDAQENKQGYIKTALRLANATPAKEYPPTRYSATLYGCGICGQELTGRPRYCSTCGQAIRWVKKETAQK